MSQVNTQAKQREFTFNDGDFRFLAELAYNRSGIVLSDHKKDMVYSRLTKRLRSLELNDFSDYCDLLKSDAGSDEIGNLVNAITTNLTKFFREEHHFDHLRDEVIVPLVDKKSGQKRLRIWSAACSSGMEPYSIAMTMRNAIPNFDQWDAKILATDIDSNMLDVARAGEYPISELDHIPSACKPFVQRSKSTQRMQVSESLRALISFRQLNLLESWPVKGPFDAIFCRNVVIYFDKPTKEKLFARFADMLKPDGWLYIGHSENLHGISDRFKLTGHTVYRKVK